jgi:sulfur transfer protein SufE
MCTVQVPDEMARYKQLLFLASKLPKLPAEDQTDDNKVKGCVSQVLPTVRECDRCEMDHVCGRPWC